MKWLVFDNGLIFSQNRSMKSGLIFCVLFFHSYLFANTISKEVIFADQIWLGGISCSDLQAGGYCDDAITVYDANGLALAKKEKVLPACIRGGGDCDMYVFVTEVKNGGKTGTPLAAALTAASNKKIWVKYDSGKFKKIEALIPKLGVRSEIDFRAEVTDVYLDKSLKQKISISDIAKLPENKKELSPNEMIEYQSLPNEVIDGKKHVHIQVNILKVKPSAEISEGVTPSEEDIKSGERTPLRQIYFPAFDTKGRINYWVEPDPGC